MSQCPLFKIKLNDVDCEHELELSIGTNVLTQIIFDEIRLCKNTNKTELYAWVDSPCGEQLIAVVPREIFALYQSEKGYQR